MVAYHWVSGYYRKDGTYVKGHYQTNPNSTTSDNWSTDGNVNPFTGVVGSTPTTTTNTTSTITTTTTTPTTTTVSTSLTSPALDYSQRISSQSTVTSLAAWPNRSYISLNASKSSSYENESSLPFNYDLYHSFVVASLRNDSSYHITLSGSNSGASVWVHDGAGYQLSASGAGGTDVRFSPATNGQYIFWIYDNSTSHQVTFSMTEDIGKDGRNSVTNPARPVYDHTVSATNPLVDETFYRTSNPDVAAAHVDPTQHYQQFGWQEARDPNPWFDTGFYLEQNPDVRASGMNPLEHYDHFGWREGRDPSLTFSTSDYLTKNPDVARAGVDPLAHFVRFGYNEGRSYAPSVLAASF